MKNLLIFISMLFLLFSCNSKVDNTPQPSNSNNNTTTNNLKIINVGSTKFITTNDTTIDISHYITNNQWSYTMNPSRGYVNGATVTYATIIGNIISITPNDYWGDLYIGFIFTNPNNPSDKHSEYIIVKIIPPVIVIPNYYYTITYKGSTYNVYSTIQISQDFNGNILPPETSPAGFEGGKILNCPELSSIRLFFLKPSSACANGCDFIYSFSLTSADLTGFTGKIPQVGTGNIFYNTFPYKCYVNINGKTSQYDSFSPDHDNDVSTYYVDITETGNDGYANYVKGNYNIILYNQEVITGTFYAPY